MNEIEDGFGNCWVKCDKSDCGLEVVRPGKVQCWCDSICPICGGELHYYLPEESPFENISGQFCVPCNEQWFGPIRENWVDPYKL
jgi:hypothetical protein